jgi:hypothetical protein
MEIFLENFNGLKLVLTINRLVNMVNDDLKQVIS